ncbi:MAG: response regulator transcription factor [Alphaproteobacteria bacterium]|nr:response regulator transcription factor [Alphaproteobacteria bacterium]
MTESHESETKGKLLIIDDDRVLADRLAKAMEKRGFDAVAVYAIEDALQQARERTPDFALIDLRLGKESGLDLVEKLREITPDCRMVMLTAFGNIATAVAAVKAGAIDYLAKPADADAVERALLQKEGDSLPPPPAEPMTAERVRWEHIQRIYEQCDRNISETARRLRMHRRTLQRILSKYAPRDNLEDE